MMQMAAVVGANIEYELYKFIYSFQEHHLESNARLCL